MPPSTATTGTDAPKVRLVDHLHVCWLAFITIFGAVPYLVAFVLSPVLAPWMRRRGRTYLSQPPSTPAPIPDVDATAWNGRTIFVVVGEASADRLAARVVRRILDQCPGVRVRGYGGPECAKAGMLVDRDLTSHAVMGFSAVLGTVGFWWRVCAQTLARWREERPDLLLTVDFAGLNVRLARWGRQRGVRTVHLVAPQLWAHSPWRAGRWRRAVDHLLAIFPFEPRWFERSGIRTTYVGHPLFEEPLDEPRTQRSWPGTDAVTVELWPGSRRREINGHAPLVLRAARRIEARLPRVEFVVRLAEDEHRVWFDEASSGVDRPARIRFATEASEHALPLVGALCASGTATAELAVELVPLSVFYQTRRRARIGAWVVLTTPWFCLVNVVAGETVVPERLTTASRDANHVADDLLSSIATADVWRTTRERLERVRDRLASRDVARRAAAIILSEPVGSR